MHKWPYNNDELSSVYACGSKMTSYHTMMVKTPPLRAQQRAKVFANMECALTGGCDGDAIVKRTRKHEGIFIVLPGLCSAWLSAARPRSTHKYMFKIVVNERSMHVCVDVYYLEEKQQGLTIVSEYSESKKEI